MFSPGRMWPKNATQMNWPQINQIFRFSAVPLLPCVIFGRWTVEGQHLRDTLVRKNVWNWIKIALWPSCWQSLSSKLWKVTYAQTNCRLRSCIELNMNQHIFFAAAADISLFFFCSTDHLLYSGCLSFFAMQRTRCPPTHICAICLYVLQSDAAAGSMLQLFTLLCFPTLDDKSSNNRSNLRHQLNLDLQTRNPAVIRPSSLQLIAMKPQAMDQ